MALAILDAAVLDEQRQVPIFVFALTPAKRIAGAGKLERLSFAKFEACALFNFSFESIKPAIFNGIFETGAGAVFAIAPVALNGQHAFGNLDGLLGCAVAKHVGSAGISVEITMRHAHAAASGDVPSSNLAFFDYGDVAQIVGVNIDVVIRRYGNNSFEFARQVVDAVQRFFVFFRRAGFVFDLFAVQPNLVIGAGLWQQVFADSLSEVVGCFMRFREMRIGCRHDVAVDVAARCNGVERSGVDGLHGPAQIGFDDAVILEGLARG